MWISEADQKQQPGIIRPKWEKYQKAEENLSETCIFTRSGGLKETNTQLNCWISEGHGWLPLSPTAAEVWRFYPLTWGSLSVAGGCLSPLMYSSSLPGKNETEAQKQNANMAAKERSPVKGLCYSITFAAFLTLNPLEPDAMLIKAYWRSNSEKVQGQVS